jgi:branched-chain amino acid transport system substrate-binding protein
VADFAELYQDKYGEEPGYHAAGGYAAGLVLENAIKTADSLESDKVKTVLEEMDLLTFYGHVKFDTGESHGLQVAHDMVYVQWQKDADGNLVKEVVWPIEGKSADLLYPLSQ